MTSDSPVEISFVVSEGEWDASGYQTGRFTLRGMDVRPERFLYIPLSNHDRYLVIARLSMRELTALQLLGYAAKLRRGASAWTFA